MHRSIAQSFLLAVSLLLTSCHQNQINTPVPASTSAEDPPSRVARISFLEGTVSFKAAGSDEWVPASLNRPLTSGDELWTTSGSRAELELGHANMWLDAQTSVEFLNLSDHAVQVKVTSGAVQVHLERLDEDDDFEVDSPQAAFSLLRAGQYRFAAVGDGSSTTAIARTGQLEAATSSESFSIRANQQARLAQQDAAVRYEISNAPALDGFDTFTQSRERRITAETEQNVSPYTIGRGDLSVYGTWRSYPAYGPVWIPRGMPPGWAPYRFGHWVWIAPWGWTWVDDAPWGFAPFHYGRWVIIDGVWVWTPGPPRIRPIYAPALVIFVGGGGPGLRWHFGVNMGLGVAWFPLGPREVYFPPYRSSRVYITNVNIGHTVVANPNAVWRMNVARQRYVNRTAPGAITAVPEDVFSGARPVGRAAVNVNAREAAATRIGSSAAPVPPSRESVVARPEGRAVAPPAGITRRAVTARGTPAPAAVPVEQQRPALERNPGRPAEAPRTPASRPDIRPSRPSSVAPRTAPPAQPRSAPPTRPSQPKQDEGRRRGIEQEHQSDTQRSSGGRQQTQPTRGRGK